jgi:hypothetical protein
MASRRTFLACGMSFGMSVALVAGCSQPSRVTSPQSPSTTPRVILSGLTMNQAVAYSTIQRELNDFLDVWKTKGYGPASEAYLVPGEQIGPSDTAPVLTSGRVSAFREGKWTSPDLVVGQVDFDLTFSGNTGAWGTGINSRFVTATARSGTIPYVLEFATGR